MKKSELKKLVEQKVDEAWYNNLDDFYHGVGKCATIGALGAATLGGCAYVADKGAENNYQYNQQVNQQAADNYKYTEEAYQKWCQDHNLNPDDQFTLNQYNDWISDEGDESLQENKTRSLVEKMVRKELKRQLRESEYTADQLGQEQSEIAHQNGWSGSYYDDVTIIEFRDGQKYELDPQYDDLEDIKDDLASKGYKEGKDYRVLDTQKQRYWSI